MILKQFVSDFKAILKQNNEIAYLFSKSLCLFWKQQKKLDCH